SLGNEAINEFVNAMNLLANSIIDCFITSGLSMPTTQGREIASMLRVLSKLQQLFIGLKDSKPNDTLARTNKDINQGLVKSSRLLPDAIAQARGDKNDARLAQLEIMRKAFADYGALLKDRG